MLVFNNLISAILSVLIFSLIPFVFYYFNRKEYKNFFNYIGLIKPKKNTIIYSIIVSVLYVSLIFLTYYFFDLFTILKSPGTVSGSLKQLGFGIQAVLILLIRSIIGTGLWEEIIFRGFLGKRLYKKLGFLYGNLIQSILFGLLHGVIFLDINRIVVIIVLTLTTGIFGYIIGYLNERLGNGSIIPSWCAHSVTNIISFSLIAFVI
ncbi:MAG: CPBP family intramembrane glutamic endopeptidase [bacterium]